MRTSPVTCSAIGPPSVHRGSYNFATMSARAWQVAAFLVLVPLAAWAWIVVLSRDMYGPMTGASAWMMATVWNGPHLVLLWAMWAVMMTAMMLPSAAPMVMLAGRGSRPYWLALGYLSVWAAFS